MDVEFSVLGGFPRNRRVRHLVRDYEKGLVDDITFNTALREEASAIIGVQKALGYKIVVDGMLEWHDVFRPFTRSWRGVHLSGLLRYFDNNFFYRIPVFHEAPEPFEYVWAKRYVGLKNLLEGYKLKAVIPGPVTFAALSQNKTGKDKVWLAEKISIALNSELKKLEQSSVYVQIDEPALTDPDLYNGLKGSIPHLYALLLDGVKAENTVSVYFGCISDEAYRELLDTPSIDMVTLDWVDCKNGVKTLLREHGVKNDRLGLGVIEARDIYKDNETLIIEKINEIISDLQGLKTIHLTTSTWLDLIPYNYALEKASILSLLSTKLKEVV